MNTDTLNRLLPQTEEEYDTDQVLMLEVMEDPPVTTTQVQYWTTKDEILVQEVQEWCLKGWPREVDPAYRPYSQKRLELSVKDGCVLWGVRVVIPKRGIKAILN